MSYELRKKAVENFATWTLGALVAAMALLPLAIALFGRLSSDAAKEALCTS